MRSLLFMLAAQALIFLASGNAHAYETLKYNGNEIKWTSSTVTYYINPGGTPDESFSNVQSAIKAAFATWADVSCAGLSFSYGGTKSFGSYDNWSGVYLWFDNGYTAPEVADAAAYAMSWKNNNGTIYMAEIVFNDQNIQWTTSGATAYSSKTDIQGVATHEIGHTLGLGHSKIRHATMFFSGGSEELQTLDKDDKNGLCYIYDPGSFSAGQVCDACSYDSNCQYGSCLTFDDYGVQKYCGQACSTSSDCPEYYFCYTDNGINQCVPDSFHCDEAGSNIAMGDYCWSHAVCQSGLCLPLPDTAFCSKACNPADSSSCPSGFKCMGEGSEGYCVKEGSTPFGGDCATHIECQTGVCAQLCFGSGGGVCTQECGSGQPACPQDGECIDGLCIPKGTGAFGDTCACKVDCATGYCSVMVGDGFCTYPCSPGDGSCPDGSICQSQGYCSKPSGGVGAACSDDEACGAGMFCKFTSAGQTQGECRYACNPVSDYGCPSGWVCAWYNMEWLDLITGDCVTPNGGAQEGDACDPAIMPCEAHLFCRDAGSGHKCYKDCKTSSAEGCDWDEQCVSMGIIGDELHGLCIEKPKDDTDTVDPPEDVKDVKDPEDPADTGGAGTDQSSAGGDNGSSTTGNDSGSVTPVADTQGNGGDSGDSGGSSGCSVSVGSAGANSTETGTMLLVCLLALFIANRHTNHRRA